MIAVNERVGNFVLIKGLHQKLGALNALRHHIVTKQNDQVGLLGLYGVINKGKRSLNVRVVIGGAFLAKVHIGKLQHL